MLRDRLASTGELAEAVGAVLVADAAGDRDGGDPGAGRSAGSRCAPSATSARAIPARPTGSRGRSSTSAIRSSRVGTATRSGRPGWETWFEMGDRIARALESLVDRHPGRARRGRLPRRRGGALDAALPRPRPRRRRHPRVDRRRQLVAHRVPLRARTPIRSPRSRCSSSATTTMRTVSSAFPGHAGRAGRSSA